MINLPKSEDWSNLDNIVAFIESFVTELVLLYSGTHSKMNEYLTDRIPKVRNAIDSLDDSKKRELLNKIYTKFERSKDSERLNELLESFGLPTTPKKL